MRKTLILAGYGFFFSAFFLASPGPVFLRYSILCVFSTMYDSSWKNDKDLSTGKAESMSTFPSFNQSNISLHFRGKWGVCGLEVEQEDLLVLKAFSCLRPFWGKNCEGIVLYIQW